jgi:acetyl esterase/lipase
MLRPICLASVADIPKLIGLRGAMTSVDRQGMRELPARDVPVPKTVSPQMQKIIGAALRRNWDLKPSNGEEWKQIADALAADTIRFIPSLLERLNVAVEGANIDGVRVFHVTPRMLRPRNRNRLLMHVHGGCYVLNGGEAALPEAILMAGFGGFKIVSVDYRMPPEAYFPAALDDVMTVWRAILKTIDTKNVGVLGTSAGGALTLAMVLEAKSQGLPLPGAIAPGTPMSDTTKTGDTFYTHEMLDNVLVSRDGFCDAAVKVYANGHDLRDPLLSPIYGDMSGFPPTMLTSGTRDLLLSNTVRVHRKLRQAGVEAVLQVFEGQSHAQYLRDDTAPETKEVFEEIATFFDKHLGD